jgi:hypothetical protein
MQHLIAVRRDDAQLDALNTWRENRPADQGRRDPPVDAQGDGERGPRTEAEEGREAVSEDVGARARRLIDAAFAEMSTGQIKLASEFKVAEDDLRAAITGYVSETRADLEDLDLDLGIFPKVNELQWDTMAPNYILVHDADYFGGDDEALVTCLFGRDTDEFAAMTDEEGVTCIVGHLEEAIMELANIGTQASRIRNRVDKGLKVHVDNLLVKIPLGGCSDAYHEAMSRLSQQSDYDDDDDYDENGQHYHEVPFKAEAEKPDQSGA